VADSGVYGESVTAGNTLPGGGMTYPYPLAVDSELLDVESPGAGEQRNDCLLRSEICWLEDRIWVMRTGLRRGSV